MQGFEPMHAVPHVFSAWLWSLKPIVIDVSMVRESDGKLVAQKPVLLTPVAKRYLIMGTPFDKSVHLVRIGILTPGEGAGADGAHRFGAQVGDAFYAWGAQLERSELPLVYHPDVRVDRQRYWSDVLLWLNVSAMVGVLWLLWRIRVRMTSADWTAALLPALIFGQSMMVVPEQRFIAVLLVMMWLMVLSSLLLWYRKMVMRLEHRYSR